MGFRFRRSLKIAPGVRLNFGKTGFTSWSFGGRGGRVTVGKRGVRRTIGIPGTGLSHTTYVARASASRVASQLSGGTSVVARKGIDPTRFNIEPRPITSKAPQVRTVLFAFAAIAVIGGVLLSALWFSVSGLAVLIAVAIPSRRTLEKAETDRSWIAAEEELTRRVAVFNSAATDVEPTLAALQELLALQDSLGLSDAEAGAARMNTVRGTVHLLVFEAAATAAGGLVTIVSSDEKVTAPDACYFAGACTYDKRGDNDPRGRLYLTDKRAIFLAGAGLTTTSWSTVVTTGRDAYALRIQRRDRQTPYLFVFDSLGEAMIAEWITANIVAAFGK